jgi:hypothetical protein
MNQPVTVGETEGSSSAAGEEDEKRLSAADHPSGVSRRRVSSTVSPYTRWEASE